MIYKRCGRCGKRIPSGTTCECCRREKRSYALAEGIRKEYHTQRWRKTRDYVLSQYDGLDLYLLYSKGAVALADTVHHIETTREAPGRFYDTSILIPVSGESHREIHQRYKEDEAGIKAELYEALRAYRRGRSGT